MRKVEYKDIGLFTNLIQIEANEPEEGGGASTTYYIYVQTQDEELKYVLDFQTGDPRTVINGLTNEALLSILIDRMKGFQTGKFPSSEGALVVTKLEEALLWLISRTMDRMQRGVEGKQSK